MSATRAVFSDVDGTLVHYPDPKTRRLVSLGELSADDALFLPSGGDGPVPVLALPPSSTGLIGYISKGTLQRVAELRSRGVLFVLVSGARTSTIIQRLPFLPRADAYVTENGGRIFHDAGRASLTAAPLVEDMSWRAVHEAVVGPAAPWAPPEQRSGQLWHLYRQMASDGWACDASGYTTAFRVKVSASAGKTDADLRALIERLPAAIACSFNLGSADFYPATSGKERAAEYLMGLHGVPASNCVSLGDDDNDLGLARCVGHTFLTGFTHDSVRQAVEANRSAFTVARSGGFLATQELLDSVLAGCGSRELARHTLPAVCLGLLAVVASAAVIRRRRHA